jgi:hypothetical protein
MAAEAISSTHATNETSPFDAPASPGQTQDSIQLEDNDIFVLAQPRRLQESMTATTFQTEEGETTFKQRVTARLPSHDTCMENCIGRCAFEVRPCECPVEGTGCCGVLGCVICLPFAWLGGILLVSVNDVG